MSNKRILALAAAINMDDPQTTGKYLSDIIRFLINRIPENKRTEAIRKLILKFKGISPTELSSKNLGAYTSMGQSISLVKNTLSGYSPEFVRSVLDSIIRNLIY